MEHKIKRKFISDNTLYYKDHRSLDADWCKHGALRNRVEKIYCRELNVIEGGTYSKEIGKHSSAFLIYFIVYRSNDYFLLLAKSLYSLFR